MASSRPCWAHPRPRSRGAYAAFHALLFAGAVLLTSVGALGIEAQERGLLQGRVTDVGSQAPVANAFVQAQNEDGRTVGTALTNSEGRYRVTLPAGTYRVSVAAMGYGTHELGTAQVASGAVVTLDGQLASRAVEIDPVIVSGSRVHEKALTSPAHVEIVNSQAIRARPVTTPVDHLRAVPGVDVVTQGVQSTNVVVRGFNNIFSGALHTLTDNRIAGVPSLRVNVMSFLPTTSDDIERMEVVLGPGAALYGPNTANGVLHMITRSPLTETGSTVSVMAGERSALGAQFRTAHRLTDAFGVKLSGQFFRAEEWEFRDPIEEAERAKFDSDPDFWRQDMIRAVGIDGEAADRRIARVAQRDFDIQRWAGELRADWNMTPDATAIFAAGVTNAAKQIELTGLGAGQVEDWRYSFVQARFTHQRLFAQAYLNSSNAGETFLLRNGAPIVDRSKLYVAQMQHGSDLGTRQRFTYGVDFIHTDPETEGTINGAYEDEDETTEWGAYVQSQTRLSPRLDLVLAGRVDDHSALPSPIFSPRAALVFEAADNHAFRATFNRAFSTPSSLNQFLDLGTAIPDAGAARLGFSVRVQGTGTDGFRFRQDDGTYQMRSPFTPTGLGGPVQLLPAQAAATFFPAAVQVVAAQAAAGDQPLPPQIVDFLMGLAPTPADIGGSFFNTATGATGPLGALDLADIDPIRESTQTTFEVGYKGFLADRAAFAADVWHSRRKNLVTPLTVTTPFVLMDGQQLGAFVVPQLVPELMQLGMPQEQAQALAVQIATGLASVPVGVVSSADVNANGAQLLATYTNVGEEIDLWGIDLASTFLLSEAWTLAATASFVNRDNFVTDRGNIVVLNAPKEKATLGLTYRDRARGVEAELRTRFTGEFPASSGVYEGMACLDGAPAGSDPCVESYTLVDLNVSYDFPTVPGASVQLSVQNLLDEAYRSFPGVPNVGRLALLRLRYDF